MVIGPFHSQLYWHVQDDRYIIGAPGVEVGRGALYYSSFSNPTNFLSGNRIEPSSNTGIPDPSITNQYQGSWVLP